MADRDRPKLTRPGAVNLLTAVLALPEMLTVARVPELPVTASTAAGAPTRLGR